MSPSGGSVAVLAALSAIVLAAPPPLPASAQRPVGVAAATRAAPVVSPAAVCGNRRLLSGPAAPPAGAVVVPAGDNSSFLADPDTTYWFEKGVHTLGASEWGQIIPADGDVFVGAPGAILDGQNTNRYAFTQHATNVTIEYLTIQNFGTEGGNFNEGVVNHDAGHGWTVRYNTVRNNAGAGVFVGTGNRVRFNCISHNGQYGFSAYEPDGVADIALEHNEIRGNNTFDWEGQVPGCGCAGAGKFWNVDGASASFNWVHDNRGPGLWADTNNNDFAIKHNFINRNDSVGIFYEISYNAVIKRNTLVRNALVAGPDNPGFPTGAVYISESGGDSRVPARYDNVKVTHNRFVDNWSGVVLWENADRFCGSPGTPTGICTLVNPSVVNPDTCVQGTIDDEPYYSDCRWKTQHALVRANDFALDPGAIDGCSPSTSCGLSGLFSNYGTYPPWSPYQGEVIEQAITFDQDNHFDRNAYTGPWEFMVYDQATVVPPAVWQAPPYRQDRHSTFTR